MSIMQNKAVAIVISLLIIVPAMTGFSKLSYQEGYASFVSENEAFEKAETHINQNYKYHSKNTIKLYVVAEQGDIFNTEYFKSYQQVKGELVKAKIVKRITDISDYRFFEESKEGLSITGIEPYIENEKWLELREEIDRAAGIERIIYSAKADSLMIDTELVSSENWLDEYKNIFELSDLISEINNRQDHITILAFSDDLFDMEINKLILKDMLWTLPLILIFIFLLLFYIFRSVPIVITAAVFTVLPVVLTLGWSGILGLDLTLISMPIFVCVLVIAVADIIHVCSNYLFTLSHNKFRQQAMAESLKINFRPLLLTSLTTIVGFLSLNFSESEPFRHFGNTVALGIAIAFILTIFVFPNIVTLWPPKPMFNSPKVGFHTMLMFISGHQRMIMLLLIPVVFLVSLLAFKNEINDDGSSYFPEKSNINLAIDHMESRYVGIRFILYSFNVRQDSTIFSDEKYQADMRQFIRHVESESEVNGVISIFKIFDELESMLGADEVDAETLAMLIEQGLPESRSINELISFDEKSSMAVVLIDNIDNKAFVNLSSRLNNYIDTQLHSVSYQYFSFPLLFANLVLENARAMVKGAFFTFIAVVIFLACFIKRFSLVLISILPNLLPLLFAYGCWFVMSGKIGMAESVAFSVCLGIIIDDTVHILSKFEDGLNAGYSVTEALLYSFEQCGTALLLTTTILCFGFGLLSFSGFGMISSLGTLCFIAVAFALFFDLMILPALIMMCFREPRLCASS